jgi:hypothetical protein
VIAFAALRFIIGVVSTGGQRGQGSSDPSSIPTAAIRFGFLESHCGPRGPGARPFGRRSRIGRDAGVVVFGSASRPVLVVHVVVRLVVARLAARLTRIPIPWGRAHPGTTHSVRVSSEGALALAAGVALVVAGGGHGGTGVACRCGVTTAGTVASSTVGIAALACSHIFRAPKQLYIYIVTIYIYMLESHISLSTYMYMHVFCSPSCQVNHVSNPF